MLLDCLVVYYSVFEFCQLINIWYILAIHCFLFNFQWMAEKKRKKKNKNNNGELSA